MSQGLRDGSGDLLWFTGLSFWQCGPPEASETLEQRRDVLERMLDRKDCDQ